MPVPVLREGLTVDPTLAAFLEGDVLPGSGIAPDRFWRGFAAALARFIPENRALLARRDALQTGIDAWYRAGKGRPQDAGATRAFLESIGYLVPEGPDFTLDTTGTDPEIATLAGPQLVVPSTNARYVLNAANARWGSLYDALYGTDALGDAPVPGPYDPARGARVVAWVRAHLDAVAPLAGASWTAVTGLGVDAGHLMFASAEGSTTLADPSQFAGYAGGEDGASFLIRINGLLAEVIIDRHGVIGGTDPAGIADVRIESALSAIIDAEDSVAAVDGEDKTQVYRNWLGLMDGTLTEEVTKGGKSFVRRLNADTQATAPDGTAFTVKRRALLLVRNVGHLMTTPALRDPQGAEVPEGLLDAFVTVLCARAHRFNNSATGAVYVVKPKMHGPQEVAFADRVFDAVEEVLDLPRHTVKLGIMDEERRTSANLKECIRAARHRVAFINTGFLDRTGDEIHTAMQAGPMLPKGEMKSAAWLRSYEDRNVDIGLACGLPGRAQIGKGMWAAPEQMAKMLAEKIAHPSAGANTAWVPSPTAATLHATHYHRVNVAARQREIAVQGPRGRLEDLLTIPLAVSNFSPAEVRAEVENNAQGILGYVVRWVDQGVGCSKVPDIHDVALMEDRATCRISSQAIANWLAHGVVTRAEVEAAFRRMAEVVDRQNADDPAYRPMAPGFDGEAFRTALALALDGADQPSGYTEPLLHAARRRVKGG